MSSEAHTVEWDGETDRGTATFVDADEVLHSLREVLGRKWHPVILYHLLEGPMRFSALKSEIDGVSSKMLSESLDTLEGAGVLDRRLLSDQPVRVEYALTERGRALEPVLSSMVHWGVEYGLPEGEKKEREGGRR